MSAHALALALAQDTTITVRNGWPKDAIFIRGYYDHETEQFVMIFEHPTFPMMHDGAILLRSWLTIESVDHAKVET